MFSATLCRHFIWMQNTPKDNLTVHCEFLRNSTSYIRQIDSRERFTALATHTLASREDLAVLAGSLRMSPEISAKQLTYFRPKQIRCFPLLPQADYLAHFFMTTIPELRLNACFLYSICPSPHLRNELVNDRKETGGEGKRNYRKDLVSMEVD